MTTTTNDIPGPARGHATLTPEQLDGVEARVDGPLPRAEDEGWGDAVLVWNGMVATVVEHRRGENVAVVVEVVLDECDPRSGRLTSQGSNHS